MENQITVAVSVIDIGSVSALTLGFGGSMCEGQGRQQQRMIFVTTSVHDYGAVSQLTLGSERHNFEYNRPCYKY